MRSQVPSGAGEFLEKYPPQTDLLLSLLFCLLLIALFIAFCFSLGTPS